MSRRRAPSAAPLVALLSLTACGAEEARSRAAPTPERCPEGTCFGYTPRWAFEPWISKDISTGPDTYAFVEGFKSRDIPVGVVVLDSPWETSYNTFIPNPTRYPEFSGMVADLRAAGVRVVCWMTGMVNFSSFDVEDGGDAYFGPASNYAEGEARGFYVSDGQPWTWWKGRGGAVDYFDAEARAWWHAQQRPLLEAAGVSGWKLDFVDEYITDPTVETAAGTKARQEYGEQYYQAEWENGVAVRGLEEFVTMSRPYDRSYGEPGRFFSRKEHVSVAWVGDNRRDWVGLSDALDHIFRSAAAGYVVIGSDIGGYLDVDDEDLLGPGIPFDQENFARWTALGALTPFMQLHGRANLEPWAVPDRADETVALYRYWATLHHELVPFFFSLAERGWAGGPVPLLPVGDEASWPGDYRFTLGEALLVAPLLDATGARDVPLPAGSDWYDWWAPGADALPGGSTVRADFSADRSRIPLYVRAGAIIPLEVSSAVTALGTTASADALTVLVWPGAVPSSFAVHERDHALTTLTVTPEGGAVRVCVVGPLERRTLFRVRREGAPTRVALGSSPLTAAADRDALDAAAESGAWRHDTATRSTWVAVPARRARDACVTVE